MCRMIIDRFEGKKAVCERMDGTMFDVARSEVPVDAAEGDVLVCEKVAYRLDIESTKARHECIAKKAKAIFKD